MKKLLVIILLLLLSVSFNFEQEDSPLTNSSKTVSRGEIALREGEDFWISDNSNNQNPQNLNIINTQKESIQTPVSPIVEQDITSDSKKSDSKAIEADITQNSATKENTISTVLPEEEPLEPETQSTKNTFEPVEPAKNEELTPIENETQNETQAEDTVSEVKTPITIIDYSIVQRKNSFLASFTLLNNTEELQEGKVILSLIFPGGKQFYFNVEEPAYRFKMQVPKEYILILTPAMKQALAASPANFILIELEDTQKHIFFKEYFSVN